MMRGRSRGTAAAVTAAAIAGWLGVTAAPAASAEVAPPGATAVVVLVGAPAQNADLGDLLSELLGREGIAVELVHAPTFRAADLLAPGEAGEGSVSVFIEVPSDRVARLSFRGPRADRFLLRELGLGDGLDDVGREAVAQVVESSVVVLFSLSSEGMNRDEARVALASPPLPPPAPGTIVDLGPRPAAPGGPDVSARPTVSTSETRRAERTTGWHGWLAPRYSVAYAGPELGPAHGPGLEAAFERAGTLLLLRARLVAERRFVQIITTPELDANLQADSGRLLLELGWAPGVRQAISLGLGLGVDAIAIQPGPARMPGVTPAAPETHIVPMARGELRYELGGAAWRIAGVLLVDTSLYDTHYDLVRTGTSVRLATPWSVRPGAAIVVGWRI